MLSTYLGHLTSVSICTIWLTGGFATESVGGEAVEVFAPALFVLDAELIEVGPGIDPGVMQIVEGNAHGVVAHRLQPDDPDMRASGNHGLLARTVSLDFGRWALDTQIFGRETKPGAIVEGNFEQLIRFFEAQLERPARRPACVHSNPLQGEGGRLAGSSSSRSRRASSTSMIGMPSRIG